MCYPKARAIVCIYEYGGALALPMSGAFREGLRNSLLIRSSWNWRHEGARAIDPWALSFIILLIRILLTHAWFLFQFISLLHKETILLKISQHSNLFLFFYRSNVTCGASLNPNWGKPFKLTPKGLWPPFSLAIHRIVFLKVEPLFLLNLSYVCPEANSALIMSPSRLLQSSSHFKQSETIWPIWFIRFEILG